MKRTIRRSRDRGGIYLPGERMPFWALAALLVCTFLMGGSSREDVLSLVVLRPLSIGFLAYALWGLTREQFAAFRGPLLLMAALVFAVAVQLVPLPPAIWQSLPGRDIVVAVDRAAEVGNPWRPFTLVPWRAWNALFALAVPAAAMILAVRCTPEQRARALWLVIGFGLASAMLAYLQAISGYRPSFYLYQKAVENQPNGLFANRNHQASLIACLFPLLAALSTWRLRGRETLLRVACAVAAIVLFILLIITGSRAGFAVGLLGLGAGALIVMRDGKLALMRSRRWLLGIAGSVVAGAIVAFTVLTSRATAIDRIFADDTGQEMRPDIWAVTWEAIGTYFPLGSGAGSFVEVYKVHEPTRVLSELYVNHAHNDWLEWLLEGGVVAGAVLVLLVVCWMRASWRLVFTGGRAPVMSERIALAASASILILGLSSLVDYPLRVPSLAALASLATIWMAGSGWERLATGMGVEPQLGSSPASRSYSRPRRTEFSA